MALLQSKPAPMYILDEIDAALDLFHTQHIGTLFRTHFRSSQFIVVSLKEGLFINANGLFRTRFRDGTSIVECTVLVWYFRARGRRAARRGCWHRGGTVEGYITRSRDGGGMIYTIIELFVQRLSDM